MLAVFQRLNIPLTFAPGTCEVRVSRSAATPDLRGDDATKPSSSLLERGAPVPCAPAPELVDLIETWRRAHKQTRPANAAQEVSAPPKG